MKILDIKDIGSSSAYKTDKNFMFKTLTSGKHSVLTNPLLIRAFREIDRKDFVPEKHEEDAYEEKEIKFGYNESLTRPSIIAQILELLQPELNGKYLDIGTGTGYVAALLGFVAGENGQVFTIERIQWIWELARSNILKYPDLNNIKSLYRDGKKGLIEEAPFDGIHISFAIEEIPNDLKMQLNMEGGKMVVPSTNDDLRVIERHGENFIEEIVPEFIFDKGKDGVT